jgi:arylsulfatase A-like enzyme
LDKTTIIITADHGESMTDHQIYWDHPDSYEDQIRIPLIMTGPTLSRGKQIDAMVQHIDLAPTILDFANIDPKKGEPAKQLEGESLLSLIDNKADKLYDYVYFTTTLGSARVGIRSSEWKLFKTIDKGAYERPARELFCISKDPWEEKDIYKENKDLASQLERNLDHWIEEKIKGKTDPVRYESECGIGCVLRNKAMLKGMTIKDFHEKVVIPHSTLMLK